MQDQHDGNIMGVVGIPSDADVAAIKAASEPYCNTCNGEDDDCPDCEGSWNIQDHVIANMVKLGAINYNDYEEWYY